MRFSNLILYSNPLPTCWFKSLHCATIKYYIDLRKGVSKLITCQYLKQKKNKLTELLNY